jgi:hypothetical protein
LHNCGSTKKVRKKSFKKIQKKSSKKIYKLLEGRGREGRGGEGGRVKNCHSNASLTWYAPENVDSEKCKMNIANGRSFYQL